jgi:hypothetical protein
MVPLVDDRGTDKTWVYGALRPGDGQAVTLTAPSRNSVGYQRLLAAVELANPTGAIAVITTPVLTALPTTRPHLPSVRNAAVVGTVQRWVVEESAGIEPPGVGATAPEASASTLSGAR